MIIRSVSNFAHATTWQTYYLLIISIIYKASRLYAWFQLWAQEASICHMVPLYMPHSHLTAKLASSDWLHTLPQMSERGV